MGLEAPSNYEAEAYSVQAYMNRNRKDAVAQGKLNHLAVGLLDKA